MNTTISTIRSVLIRTCMTNVQKEINQLEYWLNNLSDNSSTNNQIPSASYDNSELSQLHRVINTLTEEINNQKNTLSNILERIDQLEGFNRPNREIFINENENQNQNDPWLDDECQPLLNEIVNNDNISEPLYPIINNYTSEKSSIATPSIIPDVPEDRSLPPDIDSDTESVAAISQLQKVIKEEVEVEVEVEEVEEEVEEVEEEVEEEEVEEEDGLELEEINYKGVRYYKDDENFIYSIDSDDNPSENPIGIWKEKTQTIGFYKTK
jgi:predicted  nucleic acid-binding Zn-ribbon protein